MKSYPAIPTEALTISGGTEVGVTDGTTAAPLNAGRTALETEFNNLLTQIDQLARDASFNGNNLLQSDDLNVIFNENGTSSLTITGVDFDSGAWASRQRRRMRSRPTPTSMPRWPTGHRDHDAAHPGLDLRFEPVGG